MIRFSFFPALLLSITAATAQRNIRGLINAEKQFAWYTASHTVKEGFLAFMDSTGVVFRNGSEINALETYHKQNATPGILNWEPAFAVISASGEMGATTGPYDFRAKTLMDTVLARGSFFSIWRINRQGEWKNIADLGTSYQNIAPAVQQVKEITLQKSKPAGINQSELLQIDKKFNQALEKKDITAWMPFISTDSWFNFDGQLPATSMMQIADALQKLPQALQITIKAGELSRTGDFGYTYGTVLHKGKLNNYLRAWIFRNRQWQVIMQTFKW